MWSSFPQQVACALNDEPPRLTKRSVALSSYFLSQSEQMTLMSGTF